MFSIKQIVSNWDLELEEKNLKQGILEKWEQDIDNEDAYNDLLRICEKFLYYSPKLTGSNFKIKFEEFISKNKQFDIENTIFMPMRKLERNETAVEMFNNFSGANEINAYQTYMDRPFYFIQKYENISDNIMKWSDEIIGETDEKNRREIEKKIEKYLLINNNFYYFNIKNIFFVDDFIGTGRSAATFLTELLKYETIKRFNIYLFVLEVSQDAIEKLEQLANGNKINLTLIYSRISINVLEQDVVFNNSEIISAQKNIDYISSKYKITGGEYCINNAVASYVNSPNNNLPLLHKEINGWTPIFKRRNKLSGKKPTRAEIKDFIKKIESKKSN